MLIKPHSTRSVLLFRIKSSTQSEYVTPQYELVI